MQIERLIQKARAAGLKLDVRCDQVIVRGPRGHDDLIRTLLRHSKEIIKHLRKQSAKGLEPGQRQLQATSMQPDLRKLVEGSGVSVRGEGSDATSRVSQESLCTAVARIAPKARELGWTRDQLFLNGPRDLRGLLGLLKPGDRIVDVRPDNIEIQTTSGRKERFYRPDLVYPW